MITGKKASDIDMYINDSYGGFINCNHVARFYYMKNTYGTYSIVARLVDGYEEVIDILETKEDAIANIEHIINKQEKN